MLAAGRTEDTAQRTAAICNEVRRTDSIFMIVYLVTAIFRTIRLRLACMTGRHLLWAEPFDYIRRALTGRSAFATGPNDTFKPTCAE